MKSLTRKWQSLRAGVGHILAGRRRTDLRIAGMEASGSTFTYQACLSLGYVPRKTHAFVADEVAKIVTYRDPRDVICSNARRGFRDVYEAQGPEAALLAAHARQFVQYERHRYIERYQADPRATLIRYEDYFNGREPEVVQIVAGVLGVDCNEDRARAIADEWSLDRNQQRSASMQQFSQWDRTSGLHGQHISSGGRVGVWRDLFTDRVKQTVKENLGDWLIQFGYEQDKSW